MEQIKVNMAPCGFTPTIHASQNDNSTRKWGFELYDEDGKIDSSDIKEQMIFDSRVGGTEQILPENTADPTTSPIIADIQYPDSLRSEQTFLYRESPTQEDGQAKITHIKGNTLVWNQLISSPTFTNSIADTRTVFSFRIATMSPFVAYYTEAISTPKKVGVIFTKTQSGELRIFHNGQSSNIYFYSFADSLLPLNHKYLFSADLTSVDPTTVGGINGKNAMFFDLTQMGLDYITSVDQFTSLYPLPYYAYTTGKLLPFLGEELKTTGKNFLDVDSSSLNKENNQVRIVSNQDGTFTLNGTASGNMIMLFNIGDFTRTGSSTMNDNVHRLGLGTYTVSGMPSGTQLQVYGSNVNDNSNSINIANRSSGDFDVTEYYKYTWFRLYIANGSVFNNTELKPMVTFKDVSQTYEPYTTSTLSLPTLTYFPTGMKSAGSVYDEITESKAITRIGSYTFTGNETWRRQSDSDKAYYSLDYLVRDVAKLPVDNGHSVYSVTVLGEQNISYYSIAYGSNKGVSIAADGRIGISTDIYNNISILTGTSIYFELLMSTEESITTASLVTEKGETPLYYDDELIADCNETISNESGIFDAKIKLMTDETIYSQKIQLHVERKP